MRRGQPISRNSFARTIALSPHHRPDALDFLQVDQQLREVRGDAGAVKIPDGGRPLGLGQLEDAEELR